MEGAILQNGRDWSQPNSKPGFVDGSEKSKTLKFSEINEPSELHSLLLPDTLSGAKATSSVAPYLYPASNGALMTNGKSETNAEDAVSLFLSKSDSYIVPASGGKIFLYNMLTFKTMTMFMNPPPAATFIAFNPQDNNILAIGMDDFSVEIYNVRLDKVIDKPKGHEKSVTGLTFSNALNVLVSSGADVIDKLKDHEKRVTGLTFSNALNVVVSSGADAQVLYACLEDGSLVVLTVMTLQLRCHINPAKFISSCPSSRAYPIVAAAHPPEPNQFAVDLTDGGVCVLEPLESKKNWGDSPPPESTAGPRVSSSCGSDR